ncbi:MAG: glycosyltransferase family 2 protein [Bryobacteraceae bacterium]|jgi:glycosyltransferase involved in cell wall biosynthesis
MKTISVITPCYNEEDNVREVYERVRAAVRSLGGYHYEHIFIDNASRDHTVAILRQIARTDTNLRIIVNTRNFGHIRSPMHALGQASGDAVILLASDLQDPPELIVDMVREWERGTPVVIGVKAASDENRLMFWMRTAFYRLIQRVSETETYQNFTGFGLYDRRVVEIVRNLEDPYPYFRGMIAEIGLPHAEIPYNQPERRRGLTKNNLYTLYDLAMLGITNLSKVPLRMVTFAGFVCSFLSVLVSFGYLVYKLLFWNRFTVGIAPAVIGLFLVASLQMLFLGILGEYIGAVHTLVQSRPLVFEQERVNFEHAPGPPTTESAGVAHDVPRGDGEEENVEPTL